MKKNSPIWRVLSLMLFVLAAVCGGGAMAAVGDGAAVVGDEAPSPTPEGGDTDPANPETNDLHIPGDGAAGQVLNGSQASSTQQRKEDNIDDEWDAGITKFQPWRTPLLAITRKVSRKVNISNWSIKHARIGGDTLDGKTTANISAGTTIKLNASNFAGSLTAFYEGTTIFVPMVPGYKRGSASETEGCLMLFVTGVDKSTGEVTWKAVNGPLIDGKTDLDNLNSFSCPAIPADTYLCAGAVAASESQLLVPPENYQPRSEEFYVQKKLLSILFTTDFLKTKKKIPWKDSDIKENAIQAYNMRAERTYWYGIQSRFSVTHDDGVVEDAYTTKGIIHQLTNIYAIQRGHITLGDLIAISKLQHTTFSQNDHSYAFCGKNFMEWLLSVDLGDNNRVINLTDTRDLDIDFKRLKTTFGTTDFTYDMGLDMLGMEDACVVLDLEGATRYVKIAEKDRTNDMSKGAGQIRDAKRFIREEADGIALRGFNSIFVAPSDLAFHLTPSEVRSHVVSSATLPSTPAEGTIVALTADYVLDGTTYEAGTVWEWKNTAAQGQTPSCAWVEYTGYTVAV